MKNNLSLQQAKCRDEAQKVLKEFFVGSPDEIDLHAIALNSCRLRIRFGNLDSAEGRLIARPSGGGTIRISDRLSPGRSRFTIAHEIGHYRMHSYVMSIDGEMELNTWSGESKEVEANIFAAELLMPEFLFSVDLKAKAPNWGLVKVLSEKYKTSKIASAIQIIEYTKEPCVLACSSKGSMRWFRTSDSFRENHFFFRRERELHKFSDAYDICAENNNSVAGKGSRIPADAWLEGDGFDRNSYVLEDSCKIGEDVYSIIFIEDDI